MQPLWCGHAAVVGGIKIVTVGTTDRRGSTVIAWRIGTGRGSTDGSSTDGSGTDAYRHSRAYAAVNATSVDATPVDATAIGPTAIICRSVS